jgi:hypothetical protein
MGYVGDDNGVYKVEVWRLVDGIQAVGWHMVMWFCRFHGLDSEGVLRMILICL